MTNPDRISAIARQSAADLAAAHPGLPDQVEQALAADPLADDATREPIALAALIVSIASLGWTIWHDLKKDRAAAALAPPARAQRLQAELSEADGARLPPTYTAQQQDHILGTIAREIVASDTQD